ncbi:MAG: hypothetical protein K8S98_13525 [Planctomycetes bacterium]|nr:hypothetical protein [Planctomycetota bacterium]
MLARLIADDPLGIAGLCAERLAARAVLVSATELVGHAMARVAFHAMTYDGEEAFEVFVTECIDRAVDDLLSEQREEERSGVPLAAPSPPHCELLTRKFGIEPQLARRAAIVFNDLPDSTRRVWWMVAVEGAPIERCVDAGLGARERVAAELRRAMTALSRFQDSGRADGHEGGGHGA